MNRLARNGLAVSNGQTRASDPFGKYKRETVQEVRKPDVRGQSYAEQVKRTKEMLRSMDPETVKQVIEFHKDLTVFEALALAKRTGRLIVPYDVHDRILTETTDRKYLEQNYPAWTGTLIIYEAPDKKFGKNVVFSWEHNKVQYSISFKVPKQFRGKVNCALVIEHPDFEVIDRELVASSRPANPSGFVVHSSLPRKIGDLPNGQTELGNNGYELKVADEIRQIQSFAKQDGWHLTDHGIPVGAEQHSNSRYLWRTSSSYIGLLLRVFDYIGYNRRQYVGAFKRLSDVVGVHMMPLTAVPSNFDR